MVVRTKQEWREYDRQRKTKSRTARTIRDGGTPHQIKPFVGVDGEGGNLESGHEYLLLRAGTYCLETGAPLTADECLGFIANLPLGVLYVSYFFDYDVTMILRGVREERVRRLLNRASRTPPDRQQPYPVEIGPYEIDYLPRKEFKVRRKGGQWRVISDTGTFFQTSFLKAITDWGIGSPAQLADIANGKEGRSGFTDITEETRRYNVMEIDLLEQLMTAFRKVCQETGYVPSKWQGPGCMATIILQKNGVPPKKKLAITKDQMLMGAANSAYYGGRFEVTRTGPIKGPIYQYDINSAYPYVIQSLPCLEHGSWIRNGSRAGLYLAYGSYQPTSKRPFTWLYGYPFRRPNGSICFPGAGKGWYWSVEIAAARHQTFDAESWWSYEKDCECRPFDFVQAIYAERVRIGKTAKGKVLKLGLNSLYGKMAQSIGSASYANPIWAGLITANTRAMLSYAVCDGGDSWSCKTGTCGNDVVMLATDGVFTTEQRTNLALGKGLGEWDIETHESMFIIQPGLYFTADNTKPKTRGLPARRIIEMAETFREAYADNRRPVPVSVNNFIGLRQAIHRNKFETAGQWHKVEKVVSFDISSKRDSDLGNGPYRGAPYIESTPYKKVIGAWLEKTDFDFADQPDWAESLFGEHLG